MVFHIRHSSLLCHSDGSGLVGSVLGFFMRGVFSVEENLVWGDGHDILVRLSWFLGRCEAHLSIVQCSSCWTDFGWAFCLSFELLISYCLCLLHNLLLKLPLTRHLSLILNIRLSFLSGLPHILRFNSDFFLLVGSRFGSTGLFCLFFFSLWSLCLLWQWLFLLRFFHLLGCLLFLFVGSPFVFSKDLRHHVVDRRCLFWFLVGGLLSLILRRLGRSLLTSCLGNRLLNYSLQVDRMWLAFQMLIRLDL